MITSHVLHLSHLMQTCDFSSWNTWDIWSGSNWIIIVSLFDNPISFQAQLDYMYFKSPSHPLRPPPSSEKKSLPGMKIDPTFLRQELC